MLNIFFSTFYIQFPLVNTQSSLLFSHGSERWWSAKGPWEYATVHREGLWRYLISRSTVKRFHLLQHQLNCHLQVTGHTRYSLDCTFPEVKASDIIGGIGTTTIRTAVATTTPPASIRPTLTCDKVRNNCVTPPPLLLHFTSCACICIECMQVECNHLIEHLLIHCPSSLISS